MGRRVVAKVLDVHLAVQPEILARFRREAHILGMLQHPGVIQILDYGHGQDGTLPFIVMDLAGEQDLYGLLNKSVGQLAVGQAMAISSQLLEVLNYVHDKGIVHRDLKPSNIFFPEHPGAGVKLIDFSISRLSDSSRFSWGDDLVTKTGMVFGTPMYMAPEQALGKSGKIGPATDLYNLGVLLYEMLGGQCPHRGDNFSSILAKVIKDEPVPIRQHRPEVSPALANLVHRLLAKEPEQRPTGLEALERLRKISPAHGDGAAQTERPRSAKNQNRPAVAAGPHEFSPPPSPPTLFYLDEEKLPRANGWQSFQPIQETGISQVFFAREEKRLHHGMLELANPQLGEAHTAQLKEIHRRLAELKHPHLPRVVDTGELASDEPYALVTMPRLLEYMDQRLEMHGPRPVEEINTVARAVASALTALHGAGIVHRDIKPGSVGLSRKKVVLTGLFCSVLLEQLRKAKNKHLIVGTPGFMSPEQTCGGEVGPASDLFSLGCLIYALASGESPFQGNSVTEVMAKVASHDLQPLAQRVVGLPHSIYRLVEHLLQPKPEDRPASAREVEEYLDQQGQVWVNTGVPLPVAAAGGDGTQPPITPPTLELVDTGQPVLAEDEVAADTDPGAPPELDSPSDDRDLRETGSFVSVRGPVTIIRGAAPLEELLAEAGLDVTYQGETPFSLARYLGHQGEREVSVVVCQVDPVSPHTRAQLEALRWASQARAQLMVQVEPEVALGDGHLAFVRPAPLPHRLKEGTMLEPGPALAAGAVVHRSLALLRPTNRHYQAFSLECVRVDASSMDTFTCMLEPPLVRGVEENPCTLVGGEQVGDARFQSPGLISGSPSSGDDAYMAAAVLYSLLAGEAPFSHIRNPAELVFAKLEQDPPPLGLARPDLPTELCSLVDELLGRDPRHRLVPPRQVEEQLLSALANFAPWEQVAARVLETAPAAPVEETLDPLAGGEHATGPTLTKGERISSWTVEELLHRGGEAEVYQVKGGGPGRPAVLKLWYGGRADPNSERWRRFRRRLDRCSRHPGFPDLLDHGQLVRGRHPALGCNGAGGWTHLAGGGRGGDGAIGGTGPGFGRRLAECRGCCPGGVRGPGRLERTQRDAATGRAGAPRAGAAGHRRTL